MLPGLELNLKGLGSQRSLEGQWNPTERVCMKCIAKIWDLGWTCMQLAGRGIPNVMGTADKISAMGAHQGTTEAPKKE